MNTKSKEPANDLAVIGGFGLTLFAIYLIAQAYATDDQLLLYTDGLMIGIGSTLSIVFGYEIWRVSPRSKLLRPEGLLTISLFGIWTMIAIFRSWVFFFRIAGSPPELRTTIVPMLVIVAILGFTQFVVAKAVNRQITVTPVFWFAAAIGISITLVIGFSVWFGVAKPL